MTRNSSKSFSSVHLKVFIQDNQSSIRCQIIFLQSIFIQGMIAVVTGGNRGIGYAIVEKLAKQGIKTIIACRNVEHGQLVADEFCKNGLHVEFRCLNVNSISSIESFIECMWNDYDHIDILINNAAIAFKAVDTTPFYLQAEPTLKTNYFGTKDLTYLMLPLLRGSLNPRVINMASQAGTLRILPKENKRKFFLSKDLTLEDISTAMNEFVEDVKADTHIERGWPQTCYGMSKLAVIAMTKVMARQYPDIIFVSFVKLK